MEVLTWLSFVESPLTLHVVQAFNVVVVVSNDNDGLLLASCLALC